MSLRTDTAPQSRYAGLVSWKSVEAKLCKNHKKQKLSDGRPAHLYQFQNRQVLIIVDSADNHYDIGVW